MFVRVKRFVGSTAKGFFMKTVVSFLASLVLCSLLIGIWISGDGGREYRDSEKWMLFFTGLCISLMIAFITRNSRELNRMRRELESMLCVDPLTGILNRKGLTYRLEKLVRTSGRFVLYYIDLNYFKQINDTYGHSAGDTVLIEFCCRVRKHVGDGHLFARIGGDEFALACVADAAPGASAESLWEGIDEEFSRPIRIGEGTEVLLTFSRGGAAFPEDGESIDDLFSCADEKMYRQKNDKYAAEKRRRTDDWRLLTEAAGHASLAGGGSALLRSSPAKNSFKPRLFS